jgi:SAM-dependent methyltransferase
VPTVQPPSNSTINLQDWFLTPPGQYLLNWEREQVDGCVADIFGFHALQLGVPQLDALRMNRMPHRWLATEQAAPPLSMASPASEAASTVSLNTHFSALPFSASSLDLVVLPHSLELSDDPHATLREVERTLVPEGKVVICGFNPFSLWGLLQRRRHVYCRLGFSELFLPTAGEFIGVHRLRDWLNLLGFEVEELRFGCYRPGVVTPHWLRRFEWMDRVGARWWPIFGSSYFIVAVKRVRGVRLKDVPWKAAPVAVARPISVANRIK